MESTSAMTTALSRMIRRVVRFAPMVAGCLFLASGTVATAPAWGQDALVLTDRLNRLENTLKVLERQVYRGEELPAEALSPLNNPEVPSVPLERLHVRVSEFEGQLQQLTGEIEEIGFNVRQMVARLDRLVADMDFRLRSLEQTSTAQNAAQAQPSMAPAEATTGGPITGTPQFPSVRIIGQVDQRQLQQIQTVAPGPMENQVAVVPPQQPMAPAAQAVAGGEVANTPQFPSVRTIVSQVDQQQLQQIQTVAPGPMENQVAVVPPQQPMVPVPQITPAPGPVQRQGLLMSPQAPAPQMTALPAATPEAEYKFAYGLLFDRSYPRAEAALAEFVGKYPNHPLAGNAQYWLGETFYVRQNYMGAARTFAAGYSDYPGSIKAPDMLLKLGMSLNALERKNDACITFTKLIDEYPQAAASVRRRAERERGLLACP